MTTGDPRDYGQCSCCCHRNQFYGTYNHGVEVKMNGVDIANEVIEKIKPEIERIMKESIDRVINKKTGSEYNKMVQNIPVSTDIERQEINELGRKILFPPSENHNDS